jgi:transposase InsO family protein
LLAAQDDQQVGHHGSLTPIVLSGSSNGTIPMSYGVIHSDQGTQFTSWGSTRRAVASGLLPSMSSVGGNFDNAVMEAFWSRMHVELLDRKRWSTRVELANAMFEYLEIFHNRKRRHSSLGMLTPVEFEARRRKPTTAA